MTFLRTRKSYKYITMSTAQTTGISADNPVLFDTDSVTKGGSIGDVSSNSWVLQAGRTYEMEAQITATFSGSGLRSLTCRWYDITGATYIGATGVQRSWADLQNLAEGRNAKAVFTPTVNSAVELRISFVAGTIASIALDHTWATIQTVD